jgi:hypothetical protein
VALASRFFLHLLHDLALQFGCHQRSICVSAARSRNSASGVWLAK